MSLTRARELRVEAREIVERQQELLDRAEDEDRDFNDEEQEEWTRLHDDQEAKLNRARRIEQIEARKAEFDEPQGTRGVAQNTDGEGAEGGEDRREGDGGDGLSEEERQRRDSLLFEHWLRYGMTGLNHEGRALMSRRRRVYETRHIPEEIRAQAVGLDTKGGFLVSPEMFGSIVEARKAFGGIRRASVTTIDTATGNPMPIPTDDDTSNKGTLVAENTSRGTTDVTFGQVILYAYLYSSDFIKVSLEALQDIEFDIVGFIGRKAGQRIGRITAEHMTTGTGDAKPTGVQVDATTGTTGATGQTTSVTVDDLYDLKHAVDPDYRTEAEWMFADSVLKALKKLKDGNGRPLWQSGIATGEPDTIDGDPYVVNQEMPDMAASTKSILYGAFENYHIRDVREISMLRLDERFAEQGQVAFLAFSRHDGKLVDAGTNPIQAYKNSAT